MAYIKERGENTYLVRITIGTDGHGKPIQKSRTFHPSKAKLPKTKLRKELNAFVEAFESEYRNTDNSHYKSPSPQPDSVSAPEVLPPALIQPMPGIIQNNDIPTFGEFCVEYKRVKQKMLSPTSWELYEKILSKYYIPMFGNLPINEIRPIHVQRVIDFFSSPIGRTDGKGHLLAPPTIRRYLTVLQSVMTLAYKQEYIETNPADTRRLEIPKIVTPEVEAFSDEEIKSILSALDEEPLNVRALIATALFTGARRGEIVGLKWDDVDFKEKQIFIRRTIIKLKDMPAIEKLPKTVSSIREIAIPELLCSILSEYKKMQDDKIALLGEKWFCGNYVFTEFDGHVMNPQTPTKQFDHFLKRHGIRHLKFHGLRHSSATLLLSHGTDIKTVSKRLGHTSIDTTNIYVHALKKTDKAAADCFDRFAKT
ncbi:MAG TPA: hypothetical protein DDW30_06350 [Clostridiales bacterium]|nr:hypothetical protein [Clostridiales bacterium]